MELRHLRYFLAVAEELNVRRAAVRLHVSQPPLSRQIGDLEQEIGAKLFVRSRRGMQLTEAGRMLLKEARQILFESQRAIQLTQAAGRGAAGRLEIAYSAAFFDPVLLRVMRLFRQRFPMVEFGLRELQYHQQVHELVDKRIDLGYVGIRYPELEDELVFECLRRAAFWIALPPGHRLAKQRITLRALQKETFISFRRTAPATHTWFVNFCRSNGFVPMIAQEEPDGALSLLGLVSAGFGVALVPETFRKLLSVEVEFRPLLSTIPPFDFHIAWHRDNQSSVLHAFLEMMREHMCAEAEAGKKLRG
jgi:DNA-binding transcriptional LysR family regulator